MTNQARLYATARCCVAFVGALGAFLPCLKSQTAPAPAKRVPTPSQLRQYDKNGNGVLEAEEQTAFEEGEKSDAVLLTPFQVTTDKDSGYAAGNTVSGGRVNTPLALTAASISVMTKEFMEDFNITDINEAAAWTLNMDAPTGGAQGPFGTDRFESNFRGAGGGGSGSYPTRNGFQQYVVADAYNTERFEFSRGPNSQMFGPGGPGGMQGSSSKVPRYNTRMGSFSTRVDSDGGFRGTIDYNQGYERFAVRVNVLHQNIKSYLNATSNKQNAITGAVVFKLTPNTQIRAEYEKSSEYNIQFRKSWGDQASFWDRTTVNDNNTLIANPGTFGLGIINQNNDRLVYNFNTQSLINYGRTLQYQTSGLGYQIPTHGRPDLPQQYPGGANFHPGLAKDFRLGPIDNIADRDNNTRFVMLEHRFTPNLYSMVGWVGSDVDPATLYAQGHPGDYRIDVNRLLPNGQTNPNFRKAYSEFGQNSQYQQNGNEEYIWMGNYNFTIPRFFDMKQRINANVGYREGRYEAWNRAWRWVNNPNQPDPTNGVNTLNFRVYYDNPNPKMNPILREDAINRLDPTKTFRNIGTGFHAFNKGQLSYGAIVSQTSFLNEKINITLGVRRDKVKNDNMSNIGNDPTRGYEIIMGGVNPATGANQAGYHSVLTTFRTSKNADLVTYPFKDMQMKWLAPVGFVVNFSQNFQIPPTGDPLITGERPAPPFSETLDLGMRYSMPNGKAYATLSHYKTKNIGRLSAFGTNNEIRAIWTNLGYTDEAHADFGPFRDTNDRILDGWEFEVTANPTRNISLTANYSRPSERTIADSIDRRPYVAANIAEWKAGAAATTGQVLNGHTIVDPLVIASNVALVENSLNGSTSGTIGNGPRHRINVSGRYEFREGKLRGFAVNAGVNYRGHAKAGSRDARIKFQTTDPTVAQTVAAAYDYLWVEPTWATSAGMNYTRRFGKYTARFQVNVTNVLNDDEVLFNGYGVINAGRLTNQDGGNALTVANSNPRMQVPTAGNSNLFPQVEPRKFTFTTTFTF